MILNSDFKPAWWLKNGHLQTIWGSLFRKIKSLPTSAQRIELEDGDFIDLEWLQKKNSTNSSANQLRASEAPILLLLHGLEGSIESNYIKGLLRKVEHLSWKIAVMHFRGCSEDTNRLARSYHSGETEDLSEIIGHLRTEHPNSKIMVAGFSLGGNVLLKYLGEQRTESKIDYAIAVSVPMSLAESSAKLDKGFSRLYRNRLIRELKIKMTNMLKQHPKAVDISLQQLNSLVTFYDFDDQITAPMHGFKGGTDYYKRCSSRQFLKDITTPTLILHARDDPFMTEKVIPLEQELSNFVTLELSNDGGHVGFISGNAPWNAQYYIESRIPSWLKEQLHFDE